MKKVLIIIFLLFLASRIFILKNPPPYYSDVKADYEKYANIWYYGLTPYKEIIYEYPPLTIPLLLNPLLLDLKGIGKYYLNYRLQIFFLESIFFVFFIYSMQKLNWTNKKNYFCLFLYIFFTTIAKNFLYEGIDLIFTITMFSSFLTFLWFKKKKFLGKLTRWTLFWASTAIKFLTFPLIIPLFLIDKSKNVKKDIFVIFLSFLLIWGIPLAVFRTSLSVPFVYNLDRPIKYSSSFNQIIKFINFFTRTERQNIKAPDFEYYGPVSNIISRVQKILFPLIMLIFLLSISKEILSKRNIKNSQKKLLASCQYYLSYLFILFFSAKIFSQPFHIWYIPAVAFLVPNLKKRNQFLIAGTTTCLVLLHTTNLIDFREISFTKEVSSFIDSIRGILVFSTFFLLSLFFRHHPLPQSPNKSKQK